MTFVRIASATTLAVMLLDGCSPGVDTDVAAGSGGGRTSFSAVINGKPIKGDHVTALVTNSARITPEGSEIREMIFTLAPTSSDENARRDLTLRFNFPVKQGTYDLMGTDIAACNNCSVTLDQEVSPFAQYSPQKMHVSIASLTASRVTGTFFRHTGVQLPNARPRSQGRAIHHARGERAVRYTYRAVVSGSSLV